ncbi:MAG: RecB-like helicase [Sulfurospirillaceae bacterium]|nr:RecB-like helicase [Sulfurospirillaceae bacterium]
MSGVLKPYLALEASAGSGKTFALSVRYIALLFQGANPQKILALTFTNKSASEMKQRIFHTLKNLENSQELEHICLQLAQDKEYVLANKERVMKRFLSSELRISTIDAFFAGILRRFALNAGIMPDFEIEQEMQNEQKYEKFLKSCRQNKSIYEALIYFSLQERKKLSDIFTLLSHLYDKQSEYDACAVSKGKYVNVQSVFDILSDIRDEFAKNGLGDSAMKTLHVKSFAELMKKGFMAKEDFGYWSYKKYTSSQIDTLLIELKQACLAYIVSQESYILGQLGELFSIYKNSLKAYAKENSLLSFSDVTHYVYALLQNEISRDFLYFRLDGTIEHLLLDEFQDTSVVQYKILEPLMDEIVSGSGVKESKSLFFVGDVKQSIYRFRGGAKELFGHVAKRFGLHVESLDTNYRSRKNIVDFANTVFADKIKGYEIQKVGKKEEEGFVNVVYSDDIKAQVVASIEFLLQHGAMPRDIAVLVHTNSDAREIKDAIMEHFKSLHVTTEATLKLNKVSSVQCVISFLKYLYFKEPLYLSNFLVLSGRSWSDMVNADVFYIGVGVQELVLKIIDVFTLFDNKPDLLRLLEIAERYSDIESFLFECDTLSDDAISQESEGVKVLTVHKSKGLEFPHVVVADRLGRENARSGTFLYEYEDGVTLKAMYLNMSGREHIDKQYALAKDKEQTLMAEDKLNAQYVAFTRAKDSLMVCAKHKESAYESLALSQLSVGSVVASSAKKSNIYEEIEILPPKKHGIQELHVEQEKDEISHDVEAIEFGLALHFMLEMMGDFSVLSLDSAYEALKNRYAKTLHVEHLEDIFARVSRLIRDDIFKKLILDAQILKEQPLVYNQQRKQIDLLLVKSDEIVIIDYKSSKAQKHLHLEQVGLYKNALKRIDARTIRAFICYLAKDEIEFLSVE